MPWTPSGLIPPLATPLTRDRQLDAASLARLVDLHITAGADGLFLGGSTGEAVLLTDDQRTEAVRTAVEAAAGRVPVLAGAIDTGTARVIDHVLRAVSAGASAVVVTPPFYVMPNHQEILQHYRTVAEHADVPVLAYNIPSNTHVPLPLDVLESLAQEQIIVGLKDSSGDLATFRRAVELLRPTGIGLLTGSELFSDLALQVGASGIVPGLANVDPDGYAEIKRAAADGDWAVAAEQQQRLVRLFRIVEVADRLRIGFTAAAVGAFKAAMYVRGFIDHLETAEPLGALSDAEVDAVRSMVGEAGLEVIR